MLTSATKISKVWSRFTVKKSDSTTVKLLIRDLPENRIPEYLDFNLKHFVKDDILHEAAGLLKNPEAIKEYTDIVSEYLKVHSQGVTICCVDDDDDKSEIIGISAMKLKTLNDKVCAFEEKGEIKTKEVAALYKTFSIMNDFFSVYEYMKNIRVERIYDDSLGVGVHTDYRGLGICQQFAHSRRLMCLEHNVPLTGAWAMTYASQKSVQRVGWKTTFKIPSQELGQRLNMTFTDPSKYAKYVVYCCNTNDQALKPE